MADPRHLLSINSYHYRRGGADAIYLDHAALFEEHGWANTFFAMHHPRNLPTADSRFFARTVDYELAGGPVDSLRTAMSTIYNPEARRRIRSLLGQSRFDVAHVHNAYHHLTPAIFDDLADAKVPIVMTAHDLKIACPAMLMYNARGVCEACKGGDLTNVVRNRCIKGSTALSSLVMAEAYLYRAKQTYARRLTYLVAPSRFHRDKLVEWGFPAEKAVYIPNFVPAVDPSMARGYELPILFLGRLSEEKGLVTLVEASARSGVPVDIAGAGPLESTLHDLVAASGAPVRLLGRLDGAALWDRIGRARAVVLPSECYENAPLSIVEAFQLARPVIGSAIGGIPELVDGPHGRAGWLFEPGNVEDLALRLSEVATMSDAELSIYGQAGRDTAATVFTREAYFGAMSELYEKAMDHRDG